MSLGLSVYFGGTFDPPHLGHHEILKALLSDPWVETVHLVPTSQNPLKGHGVSDLRAEAIEVWIQELKQELSFAELAKLKFEDLELKNSGASASYTVDTLKILQTRDPGRQWVLAVGGDNVAHFPKWKNVRGLFSMLHSVWIFPRGTWTAKLDLDEELKKLCSFRIMTQDVPEISSTEIRQVLHSDNAAQNLQGLPLLQKLRDLLRKRL